MRFQLLATDYDNTIALHGVVSATVQEALQEVRRSGRRLVLVSGRTLAELDAVLPDHSLFDLMVLENGALLRQGDTEQMLAPAVPQRFVDELRRQEVTPLAVGRVIVSTAETNAERVQRIIDVLQLELRLHYNRDSVMALPPHVDKALGLQRAAACSGVAMSDVVAVGDGENDCSMLRAAGVGVAVENALDSVKACADVVLATPGPEGIRELCASLAGFDLADRLGSAVPPR